MTTTPTSGRHLKAHGRYPRSAYRAFASKTYAEEFACGGKFRMGNLRAYSSSEDAKRRDPSEGEGHFQRFGTVTSVDVDLEYMRSRFGSWVVRIDDPRRLAQEVSTHLEGRCDRFTGVEGCVVHYNKGGKVRADLSNIASTRISYSQKPEAYRREREFRFVVMAMGQPQSWFDEDYLTIDFGHALDYVAVINNRLERSGLTPSAQPGRWPSLRTQL